MENGSYSFEVGPTGKINNFFDFLLRSNWVKRETVIATFLVHGGNRIYPPFELNQISTILSQYYSTPLDTIGRMIPFMLDQVDNVQKIDIDIGDGTGDEAKALLADLESLEATLDTYDIFILTNLAVLYRSSTNANNNFVYNLSLWSDSPTFRDLSNIDIFKDIANKSRTDADHHICVIHGGELEPEPEPEPDDNTKNYLPIIIGIFLIMLALLYFMRR